MFGIGLSRLANRRFSPVTKEPGEHKAERNRITSSAQTELLQEAPSDQHQVSIKTKDEPAAVSSNTFRRAATLFNSLADARFMDAERKKLGAVLRHVPPLDTGG